MEDESISFLFQINLPTPAPPSSNYVSNAKTSAMNLSNRKLANLGRFSFAAAALVLSLVLAINFFQDRFRPVQINWIPYSRYELSARIKRGQPTAVLYFARWAIAADPKGGLISDGVARSLAVTQLPIMSADLTKGGHDSFDFLRADGIAAFPVLVLYPGSPREAPVVFKPLDAEAEIVSDILRLGKDVDSVVKK